MKSKVIILGGGSHARLLLSMIRKNKSIQVVGVLDESWTRAGERWEGLPLLGGDEKLKGLFQKRVKLFLQGIGSAGTTRIRQRVYGRAVAEGMKAMSVVHESVIVGEAVECGEGVQLMPGVILNRGAVVGENVLINTGAIVEHDSIIGDHCHLGPGCRLGGGVQLGVGVHVGIGATIIQGCRIGQGAVIAAGAVVTEDVPAEWMVAGVPAKKKKRV